MYPRPFAPDKISPHRSTCKPGTAPQIFSCWGSRLYSINFVSVNERIFASSIQEHGKIQYTILFATSLCENQKTIYQLSFGQKLCRRKSRRNYNGGPQLVCVLNIFKECHKNIFPSDKKNFGKPIQCWPKRVLKLAEEILGLGLSRQTSCLSVNGKQKRNMCNHSS